MVLLKIIAHVMGEKTELDDSWLVDYDPDRPEAIKVTKDRAKARRFKDSAEALELWRKPMTPPNHLRLDGKPNRPLTVFTVEIQKEKKKGSP